MSNILQDAAASDLVPAIEANLFEYLSLLDRAPQTDVHNDIDMLWMITNVPSPMLNCVLRAQLAIGAVDTAIERAIDRYTSRNLPVLWWTGPVTQPSNLGDSLKAHGFTFAGAVG